MDICTQLKLYTMSICLITGKLIPMDLLNSVLFDIILYLCTQLYMYIHMYMSTHAHMCTCMLVCMCVSTTGPSLLHAGDTCQ